MPCVDADGKKSGYAVTVEASHYNAIKCRIWPTGDVLLGEYLEKNTLFKILNCPLSYQNDTK